MILRYKDIHAFDKNKTMKIIYCMYIADEVSVHRACCERATKPYSLGGGGGGTIYPGSRPAGVTTHFLYVKIMEKLYGMKSQDFVDIIH